MGVIGSYSGVGFHPSSGHFTGVDAVDTEGGDGHEKWDERISLAPLMATLLLPILIGTIIVIKCVFGHCCVRKTSTKEEMYGVEGRMTMLTNSDAAFLTSPSASSANYVPNSDIPSTVTVTHPRQTHLISHQNKTEMPKPNSATNAKTPLHNNNNSDVNLVISNDINNPLASSTASAEFPLHRSEIDLSDTLRRATGKRQLPDLPELPQHSLGHPPRRSSSVLSHDGTSELYATVGEVPNPYAHLKTRHSVPNELCYPSTSRGGNKAADTGGGQKNSLEPNPSSDSETYASSNHPYAKLKRNSTEHPYARCRNASVNDEETDTDNYDLPQPYAQTRGRPSGIVAGPQSSSTATARTSGGGGGGAAGQGPVPPRRIGRQWRRGSQPQAQSSVDSATHFSGDSQDSRGYTSISVREPLSNIRSQITGGRTGDSLYATVSDDSEEMYAAIDDASVDGNYMQIPEGEIPNRPSWLDAANVASPIPERREANSPLPPVPAVPPPSECTGGAGSPCMTLVLPPPQTPPVYAQVTKKTKKAKAPVTPTASNASTSSQQTPGRDHDPSVGFVDTVIPGPSSSTTVIAPSSSTHHHIHHQHHRSKSRTLMDNTNLLESNLSEHRRWSKADISYSEFEVVRETFVPPPPLPPLDLKKSPVTFTLSNERQYGPVSPRDSTSSRHSISQELDEDNYNVIPDKRNNEKNNRVDSRTGSDGSGGRNQVDSDNYQEIEPISNTYQEIGAGLTTLQQEVDDQDDNGSGLYQEIRKEGGEQEMDEYEEEEDQLYEKVRPSTTQQSLSIPHPSGRKHGYEKIKKKPKSNSPKSQGRASDDEEDEDEEGRTEDDLMYEKVKYPPYERLKESRSDLAVDTNIDDDDEGSNFYEHIGYSRVKPKNKANSTTKNKEPPVSEGASAPEEAVDLNQLYAVVDKSKKKGKTSGPSAAPPSTNNNNPHNYNNNNPSLDNNLSSSSTNTSTYNTSSPYRFNSVNKTTPKKGELSLHPGPDLDFIDDNEIEYI